MNRPMVLEDNCEPVLAKRTSLNDESLTTQASVTLSLDAPSYLEPDGYFPKVQSLPQEEDEQPTESMVTSQETEAHTGDDAGVPQAPTCDISQSNSTKSAPEEPSTTTAATMLQEASARNALNPAITLIQAQQMELPVESGESTVSDSAQALVRLGSPCSEIHGYAADDMEEQPGLEVPVIDEPNAGCASKSTERSSGPHEAPKGAGRHRSNIYSLQSELLDLKSFVQDLDDAGLLHDTDTVGSLLATHGTGGSSTKHSDGVNVETLLLRTNEVLEAQTDRINTYRNVQEPAVSSTISRLRADGFCGHRQSGDKSNLAILAPQPVSPARQLKLRSSVSKLMKALPPLPDATSSSGSEIATTQVSAPHLSEPLAPLQVALPVPDRSGSMNLLAVGCHGLDRKTDSRLNVPSTRPGGDASSALAQKSGASLDFYGDMWNKHFEKQDDTLAPTLGDQMMGPICKAPEDTRQRSRDRNSISHARCSSLDVGPGMFEIRPEVPDRDPLPRDIRNHFADNGARPYRRLKKRISDLKIRLTEPRQRHFEWSPPDVRVHEDGELIGMAVPVTSSSGSPESTEGTSHTNSATDESTTRGLRRKISRWMKSAKHAVNSCKRLSNSTGGTSFDTDF
jgi:hypothetical protein